MLVALLAKSCIHIEIIRKLFDILILIPNIYGFDKPHQNFFALLFESGFMVLSHFISILW